MLYLYPLAAARFISNAGALAHCWVHILWFVIAVWVVWYFLGRGQTRFPISTHFFMIYFVWHLSSQRIEAHANIAKKKKIAHITQIHLKPMQVLQPSLQFTPYLTPTFFHLIPHSNTLSPHTHIPSLHSASSCPFTATSASHEKRNNVWTNP